MSKLRHLLTTISALAFGAPLGSYTYTAQAAITVSDIERDCERALKANTIEALEEFFLKYPPARYRSKDIACYALALNAYGDFGTNRADPHVTVQNPPGGYGS